MFLTLFLKECRQMLKSLIFYLYLIILGFFYVSQMGASMLPKEPVEGEESYGYRYADDEKQIMEGSLGKLVQETYQGKYPAYPFGFYKSVKLNTAETEKIYEILEQISGKNWETLLEELNSYYQQQEKETPTFENPEKNPEEIGFQYWPNLPVLEGVKFDAFVKQMAEVDKILGGGTTYAESRLHQNAEQKLTYEEALADYKAILNKDKITGAWARLFCDYMGILLGILPVFLAVTRGLRDKRAQADAVIYARKASSLSIIGSRYLATLVMSILPLAILAVSPTLESLYFGNSVHASGNVLGFVGYILGWLMPTIATALSVGFFFSVMTESALGILVQGVWWICSIFVAMGKGTLVGAFGWNLVPRWNEMGMTTEFYRQFPELVRNRIFYLLIAVVLFVGTVWLYELRRRGIWQLNGTLLGNRKNKSEV